MFKAIKIIPILHIQQLVFSHTLPIAIQIIQKDYFQFFIMEYFYKTLVNNQKMKKIRRKNVKSKMINKNQINVEIFVIKRYHLTFLFDEGSFSVKFCKPKS